MHPYHAGRIRDDLLLKIIAGLDEGLYLARPRHGGSEQEGRIPRHRGLMPKRLQPYRIPDFPRHQTGPHHWSTLLALSAAT